MNTPRTDLLAADFGDVDQDELPDTQLELTLDLDDEGDEASAIEGDAKSAVQQAMFEAAQRAAEAGVGLDQFMKAAWLAFLEVHPEVHEKIEQTALLKHLGQLRKAGKLAQA